MCENRMLDSHIIIMSMKTSLRNNFRATGHKAESASCVNNCLQYSKALKFMLN